MADKQLKINRRPMDDSSDDEKMPMDGKRLTLGYWKIQGLASPARMMLVYKGIEFENKMYNVFEDDKVKVGFPGYDLSDWTSVKPNLGLDFPNLPYVIDHETGMNLSSSKSVYRYIARKFDIGVQSDPDLLVADMVVEQIGQIMGVESPLSRSGPFITLSYGDFSGNYPEDLWESNLTKYMKELPDLMGSLEGFMANKHFVTGHAISYADFVLFYMCVTHVKLTTPDWFTKTFPNLAGFHKRFGQLKGMRKWDKSPMSKLPFNNIMAKFK